MKTRMLIGRLGLILVVGGLALAGSACGDHDHDHEHDNNAHQEEELPPDHACEHAQNGPFVPENGTLQAAAESTGDLPVIHHGEWSTITLTDDDGDGAYEGFVTFEAKKDGGHRFFTSVAWAGEDGESTTDPYIVVTAPDGATDPTFEKKHPVGDDPGCVEVNFNHFYEGFAAGTSYLVEISGHPEETIAIVPVPEGEGDHDHDH
ncbi:hypothetical protein FIV42_11880 [Persicimonas caeni]|uniref:Lipoprotein n=1 Tax=Persicimonas caeni TaxID=2292766 RepID=A0A4Y6PUI3_PERCE|nr:hypothetical protein [Persicimonas caeni]QDG51415.1 hypothetical protein FIV42_11880 [Persicimonas caeni]QED32636.1 hypothetical protein FRD00_11875 [Persicimonas caeni]